MCPGLVYPLLLIVKAFEDATLEIATLGDRCCWARRRAPRRERRRGCWGRRLAHLNLGRNPDLGLLQDILFQRILGEIYPLLLIVEVL